MNPIDLDYYEYIIGIVPEHTYGCEPYLTVHIMKTVGGGNPYRFVSLDVKDMSDGVAALFPTYYQAYKTLLNILPIKKPGGR